jgi:hypothetical protein
MVGQVGAAVVSDLVKVSDLSFDMLRRSQDPILRYTSERLVDTIQPAPCLLQNQRANDI